MNKINISENPVPIGSAAEYLDQLITQKKALNQLRTYEKISICDHDPTIQVYEGIGELALAAGKNLTLQSRDCAKFPMMLSFDHEGITLFQLETEDELANLGIYLKPFQ